MANVTQWLIQTENGLYAKVKVKVINFGTNRLLIYDFL